MSLSRKYENSEEELKEKEDYVEELETMNLKLEKELKEKEEQYTVEIDKVDEEWDCKYETMCEDYENKM